MAKVRKKTKLEWKYYCQEENKFYNKICRKCIHECKQRHRGILICPHYTKG